jgi:predicted XRE-type DNA-binding protein
MPTVRKTQHTKRSRTHGIHKSSGNVFEDLGLPDAAERLAKANLARVIRHIVEDRGWTQRRAADQLGIAAPDMSDLMRGKLARFSPERLARFLNKLDMHVHIQVRPRPRRMARAGITVEFLPTS